MELRPYQKKAVKSVWEFIADKDKKHLNPCVVIPTGGGKTPVISTLCSDAFNKWGARVLVVSHVKELLSQSVEKLKIIAPELSNKIGLYSAGLFSRDTEQPIIVAGIQSIYNHAELLGERDLVIVDEAHLIPPDGTGMYQTMFAKIKDLSPKMRVVGLTATPYRTNSGTICTPDGIVNEICYEIGIKDLISDGYLCKIRSRGGETELDTDGLHVQGGEFVQMEVDFLVNTEDMVFSTCKEILRLSEDRKTVLIFAASVNHGLRIKDKIISLGSECAFICGDTPSDERALLLRRFKREKGVEPLKYLVNVNVLTTGLDVPNVDCVALCRPTMSPGLYSQMIGRGFRPCEGKEYCLVLDFGGNVLRHGPVDVIQPKKVGRNGKCEAPVKKCPECNEYVPLSVATCTACDHVFFVKEIGERNPDISSKASTESVISGEITDTVHKVREVYYTDHEKRWHPESPHTLEVEYVCGLNGSIKEWICVEHDGVPGRKARKWWKKRTDLPFPKSADDAAYYGNNGGLAEPTEITVRHKSGEKYDRVINYELGEIPEWEEPEDEWDTTSDDREPGDDDEVWVDDGYCPFKPGEIPF